MRAVINIRVDVRLKLVVDVGVMWASSSAMAIVLRSIKVVIVRGAFGSLVLV